MPVHLHRNAPAGLFPLCQHPPAIYFAPCHAVMTATGVSRRAFFLLSEVYQILLEVHDGRGTAEWASPLVYNVKRDIELLSRH